MITSRVLKTRSGILVVEKLGMLEVIPPRKKYFF